ncbi:DUF4279 domain-containing protein [Paenibacillus sp. UNC217MF]|uniref:DUF4279 domain-containing protein n=1 Tax=Paenibacillus sp. UNC217MF TaxID=1449062 RepID=UPI00048D07BD|nr:DUF4279 domain-containing protein [Paenibacillus sp. UNC217MF]
MGEKTRVKVYYSLFGDDFDVDEVTRRIGINPRSVSLKGERINENRTRKETSWTISTDYEESLDVSGQLNQIIIQLRDKCEIINTIQKTFQATNKLFIVIIIEEGMTPALYLDSEQIKFANDINAEFDIDIYANNSDWD